MRRVVVLAVLVGSVASMLGPAPASAWVPPPSPPAGVTVSVLDALSSLSYRTFGWLGATSTPQVERPGAEPRGDEGEVFDGPGFEAPTRTIGSTSTPGPITEPKGDPAEVPARRTGSSEVFDNGNGTETVRSYTTPRFFETAPGKWERIDNTVIADRGRDGWLTNTAGAWRFAFGPISADTTAGGVEISRGDLAMRVAPAFAERGRTIVPEVVEGAPDTVIYRNVADGVDLVYRVTPIGLKEDVVLRARPAQSSFPFAVDGVEFETGVDGVLRTIGKTPAAVVPLVVLDRTGAELDRSVVKPSQTAVRDDARAPQAPKGAASTLTIGVDPAWLAKLDDAAFPVVLDPGFTDGGDTWQNFWSNGAGTFGNNALGAWEWNYAGNQWSGGANKYWRGFIRFPQYQTLGGQIITDAKVWAGERSGNASASVSLYSVDGATGSWSWGLPTGSPIGTQTINSSGTNVSYNVTSLVQGWVNTTPVPSKAFVFVGTETSGVFSRKSLES